MKDRDNVYVIKSKKSKFYISGILMQVLHGIYTETVLKSKKVEEAILFYNFDQAFSLMMEHEIQFTYHVVELTIDQYINDPRYIRQLELDRIEYEKEQLKHNKIIWE